MQNDTSIIRISVIVPCFNEEEGIAQLSTKLNTAFHRLREKQAYKIELVFVDDGSSDSTAALLGEFFDGKEIPAKIIRHATNQGIGAAQRTAFQAVTGDYVVTMDSDCTYDPIEIPNMFSLIESGADVVVASPYHPEGRVWNVPRYRLFLSQNLSRIYNWVLEANLYTYTSLFRVYRREVIEKVSFSADGFLSTAEILVNAISAGFKIQEYPVQLCLRRYGISKIKIAQVILEHIKFISRLLLERTNILKRSCCYGTEN